MVMYFFLMSSKVDEVFKASLEICDTFFGSASIFTLAVISLERFYAIYFPFRHRMLRFKSYMAGIAIPWVASFLIVSLFVLSYIKRYIAKKVYIYGAFLGVFIALVTIVTSYVCIGLKIRENNPSAHNQSRMVRERKLAVTLLIVTLAALLTWFPVQYLTIIFYFCRTCTVPNFNLLLFIMSFLRFCNSGINVFIYIVRIPDFRKSFLALLRTKRQPEAQQQSIGEESHIPPSSNASNENSLQKYQKQLNEGEDAQRSEVPTMISGSNLNRKKSQHERKKILIKAIVQENIENDESGTVVYTKESPKIDSNGDQNTGVLNDGFLDIEETKF